MHILIAVVDRQTLERLVLTSKMIIKLILKRVRVDDHLWLLKDKDFETMSAPFQFGRFIADLVRFWMQITLEHLRTGDEVGTLELLNTVRRPSSVLLTKFGLRWTVTR